MSGKNNLNRVRGAALSRIEKSERHFKLAFYSAFVVETLFLIAFIVLADFSNRFHLLLVLAAMAVYVILGLGLFALGAHVSRNTLIILRAIELLEEKEEHRGR
ncbi:MAG: hypothetical protein L0226_08125 [Acidobacteria bacterium]|nr:hypothetical protein [Acidobacteriota bacterium]